MKNMFPPGKQTLQLFVNSNVEVIFALFLEICVSD